MEPSVVEILRWQGESFELSHSVTGAEGIDVQATSGIEHLAGGIAGNSDDLWVAFGQRVLHFDGETWTTVHLFETLPDDTVPYEFLLDVTADGDDVWLLTERHIYQWSEGALVSRGYHAAGLTHLALSDDYVWNFDETSSRRLAR